MTGKFLSVPFSSETLDFVTYPRAKEDEFYLPYLALHGSFDPTPDAEIALIIEQFHKRERLDFEPLELLAEKLKNPGFARFVCDHVKDSELFINWLLKINRAVASEAAFGQFVNFDAEIEEIRSDDPFYSFVIRDPMLRYIRERTLENARLMSGREHVAILNYGLLPELLHVKGYEPRSEDLRPQHIAAFDDSPSAMIYSTRVRFSVAGKYMNDVHLECDDHNINDVLRDVRHRNEYDAVFINDFPLGADRTFGYRLECAYGMLAPGGTLSFDVKLPHWIWERNHKLFGQVAAGSSHIAKSLLDITDRVFMSASRFGVAKRDYRVFPDSSNVPPVAVRFILEKPA